MPSACTTQPPALGVDRGGVVRGTSERSPSGWKKVAVSGARIFAACARFRSISSSLSSSTALGLPVVEEAPGTAGVEKLLHLEVRHRGRQGRRRVTRQLTDRAEQLGISERDRDHREDRFPLQRGRDETPQGEPPRRQRPPRPSSGADAIPVPGKSEAPRRLAPAARGPIPPATIGPTLVEAIFELGDDAEVSAAASQGPRRDRRSRPR